MPFFGGRREPSPEPVCEPEPPRKQGFFHRRETSPEPVHHEEPRKHGLFNRREPSPATTARTSTTRSSLSSTDNRRSLDTATSSKKGFLQRSFGNGNGYDMDPSIVQARQRVMDAEAAEAEADRALDEARLRVREAREDVKRLEEEAKEDARRAKIKQHHAREVSKRGKGLGRHGI